MVQLAGCIFALVSTPGLTLGFRTLAPRLVRPSRRVTVSNRPALVVMAEGGAETERDWDGALRNLTAAASRNVTVAADEPVYRIASSRERLVDQKRKYVDSMNEREEQLVSTWGSEKGLLGALFVVGLIFVFYAYIFVSGGLDTPRPDIQFDDPAVTSGYEAGEQLLQSLR